MRGVCGYEISISAKIGNHIIQVITVGYTMVNLGNIRKVLHVERFHKGCFLFGKWFKEITFCNKDAFNWTVSHSGEVADRWRDG